MTKRQISLARAVQLLALGLCAFWYYQQGGLEPAVAALLLVAGFLIPLSSSTNGPSTDAVHAPPIETHQAPLSGITPKSVLHAVDNAPPFQQADVARQHIGVRVKWPLSLYSANRAPPDLVELVLTDLDSLLVAISCAVDLNRYPQIAILPKGTPITVTGTIELVKGSVIRLGDAVLSFEQG